MEEILHQLIGSLSNYLQGEYTFQVVFSPDFFHVTVVLMKVADFSPKKMFGNNKPPQNGTFRWMKKYWWTPGLGFGVLRVKVYLLN